MQHIKDPNKLTTFGVGLFIAYWVFGFISDPEWYSTLVSACLLVFSSMVAWNVVPDAYRVMRQGSIAPGSFGIIALALIATGGIYTGLFTFAYVLMERPQSWLGPQATFGRAEIALGMLLWFFAPRSSTEGIRLPRWYAVAGGAFLIAGVAFILGRQFDNIQVFGLLR